MRRASGGVTRISYTTPLVSIVLAALALGTSPAGAALRSKPGEFEATEQHVESGRREITARYARPTEPRHRGYLVVLATGDGGWRGPSAEIFEHLAEQGYAVAGFRAREVVRPVFRSGERMSSAVAADRIGELFARAKRDLGLADGTPVIVVGFSRGATLVAFAAVHPELRDGIAGAVAIALTREADYLKAPKRDEDGIEVETDARGRIRLYSAVKLLGTARLAVIQSTHDAYVRSGEARELLGADTPLRRLYEIPSKSHTFRGGRDELLRALDDALLWIEHPESPKGSVDPKLAAAR